MNDVLVSVDNVSKKFCRSLRRSLWYGVCDIAAEFNLSRNGEVGHTPPPQPAASGLPAIEKQAHPTAADPPSIRPGEFWAVRDVSFQLCRGECLGLIGRNGAGKTTLLKMLNGLIKPDTGRIEIRGQVAAMIALGAGFNPILTGRENIYVAGSLRGMTKKEIDAKFDEIVAFSEIGDFIDTPVQSYSSGMQARLGFSVAISLNPDVLLIDEVLSVGDAGFRQKAYNAITKIIENSAVIFVSHSIVQLAKVCNRGMLLRKGAVCALSDQVGDVINEHFSDIALNPMRIGGSGKGTLTGLELFSDGVLILSKNLPETTPELGRDDLLLKHGQPITLGFSLQIDPIIKSFHMEVRFSDKEFRSVAQCTSVNSRGPFTNSAPSDTTIRLSLPVVLFNKGRFALNIVIMAEHSRGIAMGEILCSYENLLEFQVAAETVLFGASPVQLDVQWQQEDARA